MAHMYPPMSMLNPETPLAEQLVYESLSTLPTDYHIFHSVQWTKPYQRKNFTWKENDFLIFHPRHGIIVLEVKGGHIRFQGNVIYQTNTNTDCSNYQYYSY